MAEINLLQNTKQSPTGTLVVKNTGALNRWLNYIGIAVLVLVVIVSGLLYFQNKSLSKQIADQQSQAAQIQSQIISSPSYNKLLSTQTKLADLKALLDAHLDWSQLLPKFFNATLKTVTYSKFTAQGSGQATISGTVPNFTELDKMIQGFQLTPFDQYINDVKLVNVGNGSTGGAGGTGTVPGIQFTVNVTFNKNILGLQVPAGTQVSTPALQTQPAQAQSGASAPAQSANSTSTTPTPISNSTVGH